MALNGNAAKWFKGLFKGPTMPTAPTAAQLYGGPAGFSGYQTQASQAQGSQAGQNAQNAALGSLTQLSQTGRTPADDAWQDFAMRRAGQASAAQRGAAVQQAQGRGLGAQAGLLGALAGSQADANANADFAAQSAQQAQSRRDQATSQLGQLGLGVDQNAFGQASQRAESNDAFNQWASGMGMEAQQTAYGNAMDQYTKKQEERQKRLDRLTGLATSAASMGRG